MRTLGTRNGSRRTRARRFIRKMRGGSQGHLIEGTDGNCYVVKFVNNLQHRRVLINDWVSSHLMRRIGISTPPTALIDVAPKFIAQNPEVYIQGRSGRISVETGVHFGSRYPGNPYTSVVYDVLPDAWLSRVINRKDFIGALVFDRWVCNMDVPQAIYVPVPGPPTEESALTMFEALMIDRGHAFGGPEWVLRDSPIIGINRRKSFYDGLRGIRDCEPWLSRVEAITREELCAIFDTIPRNWRDVSVDKMNQLARGLLNERFRIADSIIQSANSPEQPFREWEGCETRERLGAAREMRGFKGVEDEAQLFKTTA